MRRPGAHSTSDGSSLSVAAGKESAIAGGSWRAGIGWPATVSREASQLSDQLRLEQEQERDEHHRSDGDTGEENAGAADSELARCCYDEDDSAPAPTHMI